MSSRPSTEQLSVEVLLRAIQELLGALAAGPDADDRRERAEREVELAFALTWTRLPFLDLRCTGRELIWQGAAVLTPDNDENDVAATLARAGIQSLMLVPGVEKTEIGQLLKALDRARRLDAAGDQDLVTALFRADLRHVRYTLAPKSPSSRPEPAETPSTGRRSDRSDGGAGHRPTPPPRLPAAKVRTLVEEDLSAPAPSAAESEGTGAFLDASEVEALRRAIEDEYTRDHARAVIDMLLDTFEREREAEVRDEVIEVLQSLQPWLLGRGDFQTVAYLSSELAGVARSDSLSERHRKPLEQMRRSVSEAGALTQLFHVLDDGSVHPTPAALGSLLRTMSPAALAAVLVWVAQLQAPRAKAALVQALEDYFRASPATLGRMTKAADRAVVQRAVRIAASLQLPELTDPVAQALDHDDPTTRRLAVAALDSIGTPAALRMAVEAVEDENADVRLAAFEALTRRPHRAVARRLADVLRERDLEAVELSERRALFAAFAVSAGPAGVETLEAILGGRGDLSRRPSMDTRACAALALGRVDTTAARVALEAAAGDRDPLLRSVAARALRREGRAS